MSGKYILVGQTPVPCDDLLEWGRWVEDRSTAIVKQETVLGICWVSTVFLGLDLRFARQGPPILFETIAFWAGAGPEQQKRCATWLEAEDMHGEMVREVSRPLAVLTFVVRRIRDYLENAREDSAQCWRELRGLGPRRSDDPIKNAAMDALEQTKQRLREREDDEWYKFA